jgi:predicted aldo/keto reductase-like oxidoreductase
LGLATRGNSHLDRDAVMAAIERGVNYLNWCGHDDPLRDCIRRLGPRRRQLSIAVQLEARSAVEARRELARVLGELQTDYLDVVTYYYVEHAEEWDEIIGRGGAAEVLEPARAEGRVRMIGLTTHERPLAARIAASAHSSAATPADGSLPRPGRLDLLMVRYNAAHRGAEREVFPITAALRMPVVAFTCLRWGALLQPTPSDPPGFVVPRAPDWYRFVLANPAISIALMAPDNSAALAEDLTLLDSDCQLEPAQYQALKSHGDRVRQHAGDFS